MDEFHRLKRIVHHHLIRGYLFDGNAMVGPSRFMRAADHLEAAVLFIGGGQGQHDADQLVGEHKLVLIPIPVILVPFPGPSYPGFFLHELGMEMADVGVAVHELPYSVHQPAAPCEITKNVIAWREPEGEAGVFFRLLIHVPGVFFYAFLRLNRGPTSTSFLRGHETTVHPLSTPTPHTMTISVH